ncbi:MAG: aminopeptidase [Candidatus Binatia bacterium]|nr:aminopeptidase [Candidatus Binatia bacterium]
MVLGALLVSAVGCGGCSPSYVLRAAYEETRILWSREPIEDLLAADAITPEERAQLELVSDARVFAEESLGMDVGGAYGSLAEVPPGALLWVVSASERMRLRSYTWWFPIVGDVAYKGFFHREDADAEAVELREQGYDTYVRQSAAFSTLGWFDDPVLSTWLESEPVALVRLVIHELLHRTTYLPGQTTFNESFATFVGSTGAASFFTALDGNESERATEARDAWRKQIARSERWGDSIERLRALYREGAAGERTEQEVLAARSEIFAEFGSSKEINNAVLLASYAYLSHLERFQCVLDEEDGDVAGALARIRTESEVAEGDPFAALGTCAPPADVDS